MRTKPQVSPPLARCRKALLIHGDADLRREAREACRKTWVLQCYADPLEALAGAARDRPDVALVALALPRITGLECAKMLRGLLPRLAILVIARQASLEDLKACLAAGARGLLQDVAEPQALVAALDRAAEGGYVLDGEAQHLLLAKGAVRDLPGGVRTLTNREREVMRCVMLGLHDKQIAASLAIAAGTVRVHLTNICRKLEAHGRGGALLRLIEHRLAETSR